MAKRSIHEFRRGIFLAAVVSALVGCSAKEMRIPMERKIDGLRSLHGKDYQSARDALMMDNRQILAVKPLGPASEPPDLENALILRARDPEKTTKFTGALVGTNKEFMDPRSHAPEPTADQILAYLESFPADYQPLLEEYMFQMEHALSSASLRAVAKYYLAHDAARGEKAIAACYASYSGKPEAQLFLAGAVDIAALAPSREPLWKTYRETGDKTLRFTAQFLLGKLGDPDMKLEMERQLSGKSPDADARENAVKSYLQYSQAGRFAGLVAIFRRFQVSATRLAVANMLIPMNAEEAKIQDTLILEARDEGIEAELRDNLEYYKSISK